MRRISSEQRRAILQLRCPRCFQGKIFKGMITMHESCSNCGLIFNREQGFFLGALYIAYGLGIPILLVCMALASLLLRRPFFDSFWVALVPFLPITLWIFRYSRVIWMHIIQRLDPLRQGPDSATRR